jgi:hypothetical protein
MTTHGTLVVDDEGLSAPGDKPIAAATIEAMGLDPIAVEVEALNALRVAELRAAWVKRFHCTAPSIQSTDVVRRLFAWRLQTECYGDLTVGMTVKLAQTRAAVARGNNAISSQTARLHSGAVLVREWRGVEHRVEILDEGFLHLERRYASLSEVARVITGTRWSGPRFFGLDHKNDCSRPPATERTSP